MTNKVRKPRKPAAVLEVFRALLANASEAGKPRDAAICYAQQRGADDAVEWVVGSNVEDGSSSLIYHAGSWFYRERIDGNDSPVKGGKDEALANCRCWFTG